MKKEKYALISVYDKKGVSSFAKTLHQLGYKIISSGGTAKHLTAENIPVIPIEQVTKNPESFDGRMKTISFQVESGILYDRKNPQHVKEAKELRIKPIDIVVCNFYPFEEKNSVENIDIGGPTMVRAAAKNFKNVIVVIDPQDYEKVAIAIKENKVNYEIKQRLAAKVFSYLSYYDSQVARFLSKENFPQYLTIPGKLKTLLRYGENPHQQAGFYLEPNTSSPLKNLEKISGRHLSLLNLTDINAGFESIRFFTEPAAVVIKHNSPCGIALGKTISQALNRAIKADPQSAFGGNVVLNKNIDVKTAQIIANFKKNLKSNIDIIAAPGVNKKALKELTQVRKTMGIYCFGQINRYQPKINLKWINGGFVLQTSDENIEESFANWEVVTEKKPTKKQLEQMKVGWQFISRIRSNSVIVVDKSIPMTRGIGSGQTSRVRSTMICLEQAGKKAQGAILVSDSFFPYDDSIKLAGKYGIGAVLQQGGSINDQLSINTANRLGIPMVFTHRRAFWH